MTDHAEDMDLELFYKRKAPAASPVVSLVKAIKKELLHYAAQPEEQHANACPLEWWRQRAWQMPTLARLARDTLGMPGSSHALERAFSHAGRGADARLRPRLAPRTACAIIMAHENVLRDML